MTVNPSGWRPSAPANEQGEAHTVTGNRALMLEEPLIFEIGSVKQTGVDFDEILPGTGRGTSEAGGGGGVQGSEPPPSDLRSATSPSGGGIPRPA